MNTDIDMEIITSRTNNKIIWANSLHEKKNRDKEGLFIFEGKKLFDEAVSREVCLKAVFCTVDNYPSVCRLTDENAVFAVSESVMKKISSEKTPSGIFSVAKPLDKIKKITTIYNNDIRGRKIILESIRDPGNLGTIIRTARAMGIDEIVMGSDCADVYNEKTIRAAMGALFTQNITVVPSLTDVVITLKNEGYKVFAAALDAQAISLDALTVDEKTVFVIGNEGHGLSHELINACSGTVMIPMPGCTESLNAASAATILIWESRKKQ